jgi:hypothetical protein
MLEGTKKENEHCFLNFLTFIYLEKNVFKTHLDTGIHEWLKPTQIPCTILFIHLKPTQTRSFGQMISANRDIRRKAEIRGMNRRQGDHLEWGGIE